MAPSMNIINGDEYEQNDDKCEQNNNNNTWVDSCLKE